MLRPLGIVGCFFVAVAAFHACMGGSCWLVR
jgi:hypothetical protein